MSMMVTELYDALIEGGSAHARKSTGGMLTRRMSEESLATKETTLRALNGKQCLIVKCDDSTRARLLAGVVSLLA